MDLHLLSSVTKLIACFRNSELVANTASAVKT